MSKRSFSFLFLFLGLVLSAAEPRIVSQSPALTELVCHLGQGGRLVGRSDVCDYPPEVRKLPATGRFADPELERTLKLKPTLFISNDLIRPAAGNTLRSAGVKVLLRQCRTLDDYCAWVALLGDELQCSAAAKAELKRIAAFRQECAEYNRTIPRQVKILWVIWDSPLMVAGSGSLPDEVIRLAGGVNAAGQVPQEYFKASMEWVLRNQPDVILWSAPKSRTPSLSDSFWKQLDAVKHGRVIADLNPDLVQRPGPRLTEGVRALRKALEVQR